MAEKKTANRRPFYLFKPEGVSGTGEKLYTATKFTKPSEVVKALEAEGYGQAEMKNVLLFRAESVHDDLVVQTQTTLKFGAKKTKANESETAAPSGDGETPEGV